MWDYFDECVPSYTTYIVDECGTPMYKLSDLSSSEENDILESHPEWSIRTM